MMSHSIDRRIAALRRRQRRLLLLYGLSAVAAAALAVVVLLGLGDFLIRFQDRGVRIIGWLAAVAALGWTGYRCLVLPLAARLRDVDLAQRLERHFPGLDDRLVSSVEFLRQAEDDPLAGSAALRRAVIAQTTAETERLDFSDVLDHGPPRRAALVTLGIGLVAAILVLLDPPAARIAVARLVNPFSDAAWPQTTHLALREPIRRVAKGQAFEVEAIDSRGVRLPAEVRIHYRFDAPGGAVAEESERMQLLDQSSVAVARRDNVMRPFSYWVEGGDDRSMRPLAVQLVEPPTIDALGVRLFPPAYTGWPAETAERNFRALVGTRVQMEGTVTKPLRAATLCFEDGRQVDARVGEDGLSFAVGGGTAGKTPPLLVEKSGAYWFKLIDREGLRGGQEARWEIRAVADAPPSVAIERPTSNLFVTPRAVVPLRIVAKDDLAIQAVTLLFSRSDQPQAAAVELPLDRGPPRVAPQAVGGFSGDARPAEPRVIQYRWDIAALGLPPGSQVAFHATAADYKPQTGKSEPRRLTVITPEELQERIAGRQELIRAELDRVLKMQCDARRQVKALEIRLAELGRLEQLDLDHLQAAELNQRQVRRNLTSRMDGVPMHVLTLLDDLENNRIDSPDMQRRMQTLLAECQRLDREHLPLVGRDLTAAIKSATVRLQEQAKPAAARDAATAAPLASAGGHQDEVVKALEGMLGQLNRWDSYRRFHRDMAQLLREQEDLARQVAELGRRTLTKEVRDLPPQDVADLKVLTEGQLDLARRLDRIEQEMDAVGADLQQSDPLAAETVADALAEARRLAISAQMRTVGGRLPDNQIGQVTVQHKQILQDLQEVLDILANKRQPELARLVKKLREAEADLAGLERKQAGLRKKMADGASQPDTAKRARELERLAREQEQLQQETQRMARRLERLLAEQAGQQARQAAEQMAHAGQEAAQGNCGAAGRQAGKAEKSLADARRQLAQRRFQAQAELAVEQMARLGDALKHVERQEQNVLDETRQSDQLQQGEGRFTRAQAASLHDLSRLQQALGTETAHLAEQQQLAGAGAFHLALSAAGDEMGRAAEGLEQRQTGAATQQAEQNALARLALVLEALQPDKPASPPADGSSGGGTPGNQGAPGGVQNVAELKLLKLLEQEVHLRTRQLQEAAGLGKPLGDAQRRELEALGQQQGRLADLLMQLLKPAAQNPEDAPQEPNEDSP